MYDWIQIAEEFVLTQPYQRDVVIPKEWVMHPKEAGIPFVINGYRFNVWDGRAIHAKERMDYYVVHWEDYNPAIHPIEHGVCDAPLEWLLTTVGIGALLSPEGKRIDGALKGLGWGVAGALILKVILSRN